jgi:hypothetical protein
MDHLKLRGSFLAVRTMADGDKSAPHLGALTFCPECQTSLPSHTLEAHLRQAHHLYVYLGERRSFDDAQALLLDRLTISRLDVDAWPALTAIVREKHGPRADLVLASSLSQALARVSGEDRTSRVESLALLLAADGPVELVAALAAEGEEASRHLALAILGRWPRPLDVGLWQPLRALLLDHRLPAEAQVGAMAALMRTAGSAAVVPELLPLLIAGLGKGSAIDRLQELRRLTGHHRALTALRERLEEKLRLNCPRCGVVLRQPEMVPHLWEQHRLLLEGRRVREPWSVIDDWIEEYRRSGDAKRLQQTRALGRRLDGDAGQRRVERLLLACGVGSVEARRELLEAAGDHHAALCPWCYAEVPVLRDVPPLALSIRGGRLSAEGYHVELNDSGWRTMLEVRAGDRVLHTGSEPGRYWTWRGGQYVLVGPWLVLALGAAVVWPWSPLPIVCVLLLLALLAYSMANRLWGQTPSLPRRVRRYAWQLLVSQLLENGSSPDGRFLAGLARLPRAEGDIEARRELLADLLVKVEKSVREGRTLPAHLAMVRRLAIEDAAADGEDAVPLAAAEVGRCFHGDLPLRYGEALLAGWRGDLWTTGRAARLRLLLCDRAFEAGFEVGNLLDAGQSAPALAAVLRTEEPMALAALRLLWSLRPTRPWDRCSPAQTAFDLAVDPDRESLLAEYSDLLLCQEEPDWPWIGFEDGPLEPVRIVLSVGGVWLQSAFFAEPPRLVEINPKDNGYELVLGKQVFRAHKPLDETAARMERWFRYAFHEFLPAVAGVRTWQSPDRAAILRAWGAAPCPQCQRFLLARVGEVGIALDEPAI